VQLTQLWQQVLFGFVGGAAAELLHWYLLSRKLEGIAPYSATARVDGGAHTGCRGTHLSRILGFAQNILGRIRTIALGGLFLFLATAVAVTSYPFDPRPLLSGVLLLLFVVFGAVIVFVYADMHRDATLSHITNTKPGELGSEFWVKILGFGAARALGLITAIFPELSGFVFSWLQPGVNSLK
jgi:hypothetical protein